MSIQLPPEINKKYLDEIEARRNRIAEWVKYLIIGIAAFALGAALAFAVVDAMNRQQYPQPPEGWDGLENKNTTSFSGGATSVQEGDALIHPGASPSQLSFPISSGGRYRITCYCPPAFTLGDIVARGGNIGTWLDIARDGGYDGICAVSPDTPWYGAVKRDDVPVILDIEGHGRYLVVDRTAWHIRNTVDIYEAEPAQYLEYRQVTEVTE